MEIKEIIQSNNSEKEINQSQPIEPEKQKTKQQKLKYIPLQRIKELKLKGLNDIEIAKILGCHHTNIWKRKKRIKYTAEEIAEAKKRLGDMFMADILKYREHITEEKLKKASALDLSKMISHRYNEFRLETGKSTENVAIDAIIQEREELERELARYEARNKK